MIEDTIHNLDNEVGQNGSNVQQQQQQQQHSTSILERNNLTTVTELGNRSQVKFIMIVVATLLKVLFKLLFSLKPNMTIFFQMSK
jgi:hypothetical protein